LTIAFSSTTSAIGVGSPPWRVIATARAAASSVSASRSGVPGFTNDEPGRCSPSTSMSSWFEFAVP
jgi:hypothetical protein